MGRAWAPSYALLLGLVLVGAWWCERYAYGRFALAIAVALVAGAVCPTSSPPSCVEVETHFLAEVTDAPLVNAGERQPATLRIVAIRVPGRTPEWQARDLKAFAALAPAPLITPGDQIELAGTLNPLSPRDNPSDFDLRAWAERRGICGSIRSTALHAHHSRAGALRTAFHNTRRRVYRHVRTWDSTTAAVFRAVALGERRELPPSLRERWSRAGIAHLLAISGLHITLVGGSVYAFVAGIAW
ncbi:MAG: ComEC/Rec2 family competence protein, partial [Myxococcota bacterium]